jgi:hypothetical protein
MMVCRSQCSFLFLLRSFFLLGAFLVLSDGSDNGSGLDDGSVEGLFAVSFNSLDAAILNAFPEHDPCNRAHDFELFDEGGGGDVLAQLGDAGDDTIIGGTIEEDSIIGFLFNLSLGPFLS